MSWMIYGANGFTGKLVAEEALRQGERPVLAGRSAPKVIALAEELNLDYTVVDVADPKGLRDALGGVDLVAHCAGPFSLTWQPMVDACLHAGTHYLDITGEIDVFESIYTRSEEARRAGLVLLPGAGFDVVPTDCLSAMVGAALPEASTLDIAFTAPAKVGPGTAKTALEGMALGGRARVDGEIREVPLAHKQITAEFPNGPKTVSAIPWGDVASAYRSTGIRNITTYTVVPGANALISGQRYLAPILRNAGVQRAGKALVDRVLGQARPAEGRCQVWVCARDDSGEQVSASMTGPGPIPLTADAVVRIARKLQTQDVTPGAHTPSSAFGADFVTELNGVLVERPR